MARSLIPLFALVAISLSLRGRGVDATLATDLAAKEAALDDIASSAEAGHQSRCSSLNTCANSCSTYACGNDFSSDKGFHCNSTFGTDSTLCGSSCNGLIRSMENSVVRFPPGVDSSDAETQAFVCSTKTLDTKFKEKLDSTKVLKAWSYIGHNSGSIRIYPGNPQSRDSDDKKCSTYDARLRPWFIAASSGPKDIVIIIDRSRSMLNTANALTQLTRIDAVKAAVVALLGTLTQNDYVNIVAFGSQQTVLGSQTGSLMQATTANIAQLSQAVNVLTVEGNTVMAPAFTKAFDVLRGSTELTSGCTKIVLFLTDGASTDDSDATVASTTVRNAINAGQASLSTNTAEQAHVFTYSMSSDADDALPKAIACENRGVWARITDGEDPLTEMRSYYQFLAAGATTTQVRWTTPYIDDFGLGQMVTAARPIYDRSNPVPLMVGVVGADITIAELEASGSGFDSIVAELIARSRTCSAINLTQCDLQHLRGTAAECPSPEPAITSCTSERVVQSQCTATTGMDSYMCGDAIQYSTTRTVSSGFATNSESQCCGATCTGNRNEDTEESSNTGVVVGAVIGAIVVIIIVIVVIIKVACGPTQPQGNNNNSTGNANNNGGGRVSAAEANIHNYNNNQNNNNNGNGNNNTWNSNAGASGQGATHNHNQHQQQPSANAPPSYPTYPAYPGQQGGASGGGGPSYPPPPSYPGTGASQAPAQAV